MHATKRVTAILAGFFLLIGLGLFLGSSSSYASTVCAPLATNGVNHYVSPIHLGEELNAINWGGGGSNAKACTGAVSNDNIKTWHNGGVPSDFTPEPVGTSSTVFQLVYTPGNQVSVSLPLCVSTVLNQIGAYARLRPCHGLTVSLDSSGHATLVQASTGNGNQWQNFSLMSEGDGFYQILTNATAAPQFALNISGYGGNGTQVISWPVFGSSGCGMSCAENQIFEVIKQ